MLTPYYIYYLRLFFDDLRPPLAFLPTALATFLPRALALVVVGGGVVVDFHLNTVGQQFAGTIVEDGILLLDETADVSLWQTQGIGLGIAGDDVVAIHRVEGTQHINVEIQHMGNLLKVHLLINHHRIGLGRQTTVHRTDIVQRIVGHHIVGCYEGRHVATRFTGQVRVNLPVVLRPARALDGLVHIAWTAVIGSNHQVPVAKHLIEVAQQVGSSIGSLDGVATLIDQRVDLQVILLTSSQHKLPETGSSHARDSLRIEGRLNDGQVFQFEGYLIGFERLFEDRHIEIAGSQTVGYRSAKALGIAVDEVLDNIIMSHLHHRRHARQTVDVHLFGIVGVLVLEITVVRGEVGLCHILAEQTVQVVGHGLGEVNHFLVTTLVNHDEFVFLINFFFFFFRLVHHDLRLNGDGHAKQDGEQ